MSHDYYDPNPYAAPERPVVLLGQPGSGVAAVARALSGLTGWTFNHVDRLVEGRAGRSRGLMAVQDGMLSVADADLGELRRAVERSPAGVVAADPFCLIDRAAFAWVRERALTVHVARPTPYLLRRIGEEVAKRPGHYPDFAVAVPCSPEDLDAHLAARTAVLAAAELSVDAGERAPLTVADELRGLLDVQPS